ncbi:MAG: adenosylcobinamide-GDP ribazoletransferase, partial [Burkholderiaceae bacterium]
MTGFIANVTHELRLALVAVQFLTRVPVPGWVGQGFQADWLNTCVRHFPLVGAGVGAFGAAVLWVVLGWWPPAVAAVLAVTATVWLTGAFHEDGLADTFDALGGCVPREKALAIMKDSRIGTYGAAALVVGLGLRVALVATLAAAHPTAALLAL